MAVNSSAAQFAVSDTTPMTISEYGRSTHNPWINDHSAWGDVVNFFSGVRTMGENNYQAYLAKFQNDLEEKRLQSARDYEIWLDSTKYQRAVEDAKKAGINPYLLFSQNINTSSGSSAGSYAAHKPNSEVHKANTSSSLVTSALKIILTALMAG